MVGAVRRGLSLRQVARRFRVGLATVHRWVQRAGRKRLGPGRLEQSATLRSSPPPYSAIFGGTCVESPGRVGDG
ncbi:MAG: helix-turn-helix domain-containing protein [Terriglobia bacterium]